MPKIWWKITLSLSWGFYQGVFRSLSPTATYVFTYRITQNYSQKQNLSKNIWLDLGFIFLNLACYRFISGASFNVRLEEKTHWDDSHVYRIADKETDKSTLGSSVWLSYCTVPVILIPDKLVQWFNKLSSTSQCFFPFVWPDVSESSLDVNRDPQKWF